MPLYTYRCSNCGNEFDLRQSFSDDPIHICPVCDGHVRRVIQQVPVLFKGSGFYITDNRVGKANGSPNGKGPKVPETAAESSKSETKDKSKKDTNRTEKKSSSSSAPSKAD